ncbi:Plasmid recombination enzyme [Pseudobutyrivibrio sp. 49]|uniref:plasmid recombination protein n=1 Tax=Pseudobutyrivibrio sp. 49 TaxID=1855344 RepID=UPI000889EAF8|nr:plasmid recombination protein [Pseudobutyrivibrio sp. 49]SDI51665.1 Plasmid recombination enzyme [Pseudobutyrivibrio sp. 49]
MAAKKNYTDYKLKRYVTHLTQECYFNKQPSNKEIDMSLHHLNKNMTPERGNSKKEILAYYRHRLSQLYHLNRKNLVTGLEWVITAPTGLTEEQRWKFFDVSLDYLKETYGEENIITAFVHANEGIKNKGVVLYGEWHMHTLLIPVKDIENPMPRHKGFTQKICNRDVCTLAHLRQFHKSFQAYVDEHLPFKAQVYKGGITSANSKDVKLLKAETKYEIEHQKVLEQHREIEKLREKIAEIELNKTNSWGNNATWGEYTYGG